LGCPPKKQSFFFARDPARFTNYLSLLFEPNHQRERGAVVATVHGMKCVMEKLPG
jgi:hypothetical protein